MIRKIIKDDIDKIIEIENKTLNETLGYDMLNNIIDNNIMDAYVYVLNDILGYISISFDGYTLEVLNFCVDT